MLDVKFKQPIYKGDAGRDVKAVKRALYKIGHHSVNTGTNVAGGAYVKALKSYQRGHKLTADGVYGPATHAQLEPEFDAYGRLLYRTAALRDPARLLRAKAVSYANASLKFAGKMVYTEGPQRSELFNRKPGDYLGAHADCSQFVSAIMHWSGVKTVNDTDATGSLLAKGTHTSAPAVARLVVFGPGAGVHTGIFTRQVSGVWHLVEFGDQAAPDEISLPAAMAYFRTRGELGVRYLDFFKEAL